MNERILVLAFAYLNPKELLTAGQVCKQFHNIESSDEVWRELFPYGRSTSNCKEEYLHYFVPCTNIFWKIIVKSSNQRNLEDFALLLHTYNYTSPAVYVLKQIISSLTAGLIATDTLFRDDNPTFRAIPIFMRIFSRQYLTAVFQPFYQHLLSFDPSGYELDPMKIRAGHTLAGNTANLTAALNVLAQSVYSSVANCPWEVRELVRHQKTELSSKFPNRNPNGHMGGLIWIFFLGSAMIRSDFAPENMPIKRAVLVSSMVMQNLAVGLTLGTKESYMGGMNPFILDNRKAWCDFVCALAEPTDKPITITFSNQLPFLLKQYAANLT